MKRKLFAIIAPMLFVLGTFFFTTQHHADNEQEALIVKTAEALAGPGDHLHEVDPENGGGGNVPGCCDDIWHVTYEMSGGTVDKITCTSGGTYQCPCCLE